VVYIAAFARTFVAAPIASSRKTNREEQFPASTNNSLPAGHNFPAPAKGISRPAAQGICCNAPELLRI
jgi:hypothetical protein